MKHMKKTILIIAAAFCMCQSMKAIKPIETEGFDLYRNSIKADLVSLLYVAPQFEWEHFTDTRFSYGLYAQAHFMNRSTFRDMEKSPGQKTYENGETYDTKWDRRYAGIMLSPEGRFYFGRKPHRGFYSSVRTDFGIFQESFDISRLHIIDGVDNYSQADWKYLGNEKGEIDFGLGIGFGLGFQCWFRQNAHWGLDVNCYAKTDWKLGENTEDIWEWFWGPGLPADLNLSIMYRF